MLEGPVEHELSVALLPVKQVLEQSAKVLIVRFLLELQSAHVLEILYELD